MTATKTNERPGTRAVLRHSGMSASKVRQVLDLIRGQDVDRAAEILDRHRARSGQHHRQGPGLGRGQRRPQRSSEPRRALRVGLLRRRGHHGQAVAPPGPWPGHAHPQAHVPHHDHREPAARRQARAAPQAHGGGQRAPFAPGRRLAAPGRPLGSTFAPPGAAGGGRSRGRSRGRGRGRGRPRSRTMPRATRPRSTRSRPTRRRPTTRPRSRRGGRRQRRRSR